MTDAQRTQSTAATGTDLNRHAALARRGAMLVALCNFVAAVGIAALFTIGTWFPWATPAYKALSLAPWAFATCLFVIIGQRLWTRLAPDGQRFSVVKGALAGLLTVLAVHVVTIEVFLILFFGAMWLFQVEFPHMAEFPGLVVMLPIQSLTSIGVWTLPLGAGIGMAVAAYCQRQLNRSLAASRV